MPCSDHAVLLKATAQHGRAVALRRTAWSEHGIGMASVNHTRPHCVNEMGKTFYTLSGTAWARHAMCELAFSLQLLVQRGFRIETPQLENRSEQQVSSPKQMLLNLKANET